MKIILGYMFLGGWIAVLLILSVPMVNNGKESYGRDSVVEFGQYFYLFLIAFTFFHFGVHLGGL